MADGSREAQNQLGVRSPKPQTQKQLSSLLLRNASGGAFEQFELIMHHAESNAKRPSPSKKRDKKIHGKLRDQLCLFSFSFIDTSRFFCMINGFRHNPFASYSSDSEPSWDRQTTSAIHSNKRNQSL
jgi:hypothetical protein